MNDPHREWSEFDDTLDEPAREQPVPPAAKPWIAEQQIVHGLLRHMHNADARARESRVQGILAVLPARPGAQRHRLLVAAAALLLAVFGYWLLQGRQPMSSAEAAVVRAAGLLGQDVDRRFALSVHEGKDRGDGRAIVSFEMTTRPGMHFLLVGGREGLVARFGPFRVGCDGSEVWLRMPDARMQTMAVPLDQASQLLAMAGDVLDLGYLDLQALMQRLPEGFELATVGTDAGEHGERLQHIRAVQLPDHMQERVKSVELWCDEDSGMVTRIEIDTTPPRRGSRSIVLQYQGTVEVDATIYQKP